MPVMRKRLNLALRERSKAKQDRERHTNLMVEEFRKGLGSFAEEDVKRANERISRHSQEATDAAIRYNRANEAVEDAMFARQHPGAMKWRRAAVRLKVAKRAVKTGLASLNRDTARLQRLGERGPKRMKRPKRI